MTEESEDDRLTRWVREHGRAVQGYLWMRLRGWRDRHAVEDLCQEVFARAWSHRSRFVQRGADRGYLLAIADRLACDYIRRVAVRRPESLHSEPSVDGEAELRAFDAGDERALQAALARLSEPQRRTLLLRYFGQMSFEDIAQQLGCPLGTALSHCRRGLEALRKRLVEKSV
jgi:RNA polymerase sigma factor (sigma-70 family)